MQRCSLFLVEKLGEDKMAYGLNDMKQAALGTVSAILIIFLLRGGNPIQTNPTFGLVIGLIWLWLTSYPFLRDGWESKKHIIGNTFIAFIISATLSIGFGLITMDKLFTYDIFGTIAWFGTVIGISAAQYCDKHNINNIYDLLYKR